MNIKIIALHVMFLCWQACLLLALFTLNLTSGLPNILSYHTPRYPMNSHAISARSSFETAAMDIENKFLINVNTIIRTQDSRSLGAKYLNETELSDNRECLLWCWETTNCNVAVFGDKSKGSCYLFDCGAPSDFQCKFTNHNFYTSSILKSTHSYELGEWGNQVKHENELAKLHNDLVGSNIPAAPTSGVPVSEQPKMLTATPSKNNVLKGNIEQKCRHYQFQCLNSTECIAIYNVCDGIPQCPDGSDESIDLKCPQKMQENTKSSPASTILQPPTQPSYDQHAGFYSPASGNEAQEPASNSHLPQSPALPHSLPNRHEMQKPRLNADVPPRNQQSSAVQPNENIPWHEGYDNNKAPNQQYKEFSGDSDPAPSPFVHKHSKFVAANDPHPQYPNRWTDDYDQYPHPPSQQQQQQQQQQQYNSFGTNYQKPSEHYFNNQLPSDFDQATYEAYHPDQDLYWSGQDNQHDNRYEENDFVPPRHREPDRPVYPEQKFYPPHQPPRKQGPDLYSQSSKPQLRQMGQPRDQAGLQPNVPLHSQNTQQFLPYGDQSQLNYPRYPDPQAPLANYPHQKMQNSIQSNSPIRESLSKQTSLQNKSLHLFESEEMPMEMHSTSHKVPNHHKEESSSSEQAVSEKLNNEKPLEDERNKSSKSSSTVGSHKTEPFADGLKMTVAELFQSSNTHVHESNSAVLALTLGLCITALLLVLVGCRMRAIRRRISRRGRPLAHDADYLVNGMYL